MQRDELYELAVPSDTEFGFPYTPYDIQLKFMRHVFAAIEKRQVALVESPTGTGKSLSLICSTLSWILADLSRTRKAAIEELRKQLAPQLKDEPQWAIDNMLEKKRHDMERQEAELEERIQAIRKAEEAAMRKWQSEGPARKKQRLANPSNGTKQPYDSDDDFAPEEPILDGGDTDGDGMSAKTRDMLRRYRARGDAMLGVELEPDVTKVFYTSRTHSQLSQFMAEIRKTPLATARTIPLASRVNLCINDEVKSKSSGSEDLNERCLDLQRKGSKSKASCPYLPSDTAPLNDFRDYALASVHAIEDLEDLGRRKSICPYYGARHAIRQAQLVALPYQMILSKVTREALDISLDGHVVVVDEAHALIDTILNTHTVTINSNAIASILHGCVIYFQGFKNKLKGVNVANLKQLHAVLVQLRSFCVEWKGQQEEMKTANEVVQALGLDQVPFAMLDDWIRAGKMAQKISGYAESQSRKRAAKQDGQSTAERKAARAASINMFYRLQAFLLALTEADDDGRIIVSTTPNGEERIITLKYLLLNPEKKFRDVVNEARAVILAGGTMAPMRDFEQQLFSYLSPNQLSNLICSHVVAADHLLVRAIGTGPGGARLALTYEARKDTRIIDELGQALVNLASVATAGCVCFFPSYALLDSALDRWRCSGHLDRLSQKKQIFTEPKATGATDQILQSFATACGSERRGGMLLAVVGAKLSEGINFSDDLCRMVIVIGVPFPPLASIELKERMRYIKEAEEARSGKKGSNADKQYYMNLAFRAVNQAIGRAIRHRDDWASIILLDARYAQQTSQQLLPAWIKGRLEVAPNFTSALQSIAKFMKTRNAA